MPLPPRPSLFCLRSIASRSRTSNSRSHGSAVRPDISYPTHHFALVVPLAEQVRTRVKVYVDKRDPFPVQVHGVFYARPRQVTDCVVDRYCPGKRIGVLILHSLPLAIRVKRAENARRPLGLARQSQVRAQLHAVVPIHMQVDERPPVLDP